MLWSGQTLYPSSQRFGVPGSIDIVGLATHPGCKAYKPCFQLNKGPIAAGATDPPLRRPPPAPPSSRWTHLATCVKASLAGPFHPSHPQVPLYKFVPLVYQMASRVSTYRSSPNGSEGGAAAGGAEFQRVLQRSLLALAAQHPHHTLPHLLALK